jgi:hypothetical protein
VFELITELILQVVVESLFEVTSHGFSKRSWVLKTANAFLALLIYFGLGAISGLIVTVFVPNRLIHNTHLRGISLLIVPSLAALTMVGIGRLRRWQGKPLVHLDSFAYAFVFAFGMALARFLFEL